MAGRSPPPSADLGPQLRPGRCVAAAWIWEDDESETLDEPVGLAIMNEGPQLCGSGPRNHRTLGVFTVSTPRVYAVLQDPAAAAASMLWLGWLQFWDTANRIEECDSWGVDRVRTQQDGQIWSSRRR